MNTRINYEYRDASNYHWHGSIVVAGGMTPELWSRIRASCDSREFFIADQVGFPEVFGFKPGPHQSEDRRTMGYSYDPHEDHCWHRFPDEPHAWELTADPPSAPYDVNGMVKVFESIAASGWSPFDPELKT
jgi:hypothetical protein